jgi:methionine-rich copper-binding protein CopC
MWLYDFLCDFDYRTTSSYKKDNTELNMNTVTPVSLGQIKTGILTQSDNWDYFVVTLTQSGIYSFYTTGTTDTSGYLYDSGLGQIGSDYSGGEGNNFNLKYTLGPGTYYVGVTGGSSGAYALHLEGSGAGTVTDDHGFTPWSATNVELGQIKTGTLTQSDDWDYFKVTLTQSGTYSIYTTGTTGTIGYLYDRGWSEIGRNNYGGEGNNFNLKYTLGPGTYYVGVTGWSSGAYALHLEGAGAGTVTDDHGFTPWSATNVELGQIKTGTLTQPDDWDYFKVTLTQSGIYSFFTTGTTGTLGYLYDSGWSEIGQNNYGGEGNNFNLKYALGPGTYYVGVTGGSSGAYALHLEGSGAGTVTDDHGFTPWSATNVELGQIKTGTLTQPDDWDYFKVTLTQSGTYSFVTTGTTDTIGYLYDSGWGQIGSDQNGGEGNNFNLKYTLGPGIYYVGVTGGSSGAYALHLEGSGAGTVTDDHGFTPWSATNIEVGQIKTGTLTQSDDWDYFKVTLTQSGTYSFFTMGTTDTIGYLYDSGWGQIGSDQNGGEGNNFNLKYALGPGTYYVGVTGGSSGSYALHMDINTESSIPSWAATQIAVGTITDGALISPDAQDYYKFTVTESAKYVLYTMGLANTQGQLFNSHYDSISTDYSSGLGDNFAIGEFLNPGTYYLKVTSESWLTGGDYEVHIDGPGKGTVTDDHGFSAWAATAVDLGSTTLGNLSASDDADYFQFTVTESAKYVLYTTSLANTQGQLFNSHYDSISTDYSSGLGDNFAIGEFLNPGTYYLKVSGESWLSGGDYEIHIDGPGQGTVTDDHGFSAWSASPVQVGSTMLGNLSASDDADYFQFTVTESAKYVLYTTGLANTQGQLFNSHYDSISTDYSSGLGDNFAIGEFLNPGTYYIKVSSESWLSGGDYEIHIDGPGQGTLTDDHGFSAWSASPVQVGSTTLGNLSASDDADYFQFTVLESANYVLYTTGLTDTQGQLFNSHYDSISTDYSSGLGDNFAIGEFLNPGTYYLKVSGESWLTGGDYEVHIDGPGKGTITDDHGFSAWAATAVDLGSTTLGNLSASDDADYFQFTVTAQAKYVLYTTGLTNTYGQLFNSNYDSISTDPDSGPGNNFAIDKVLNPGTYYLKVTGINPQDSGDYQVHISDQIATVLTVEDSAAVFGGHKWSVLADFSQAAYAGDGAAGDQALLEVMRSWVPLTNADLSISGTINALGYYSLLNASAIVARAGDAAIIAFTGTNPTDPLDWSADLVDMGEAFILLQPLITAFDQYVNQQGISKVYVTGHSLGGALAQKYMSVHSNTAGTLYDCVTFAAPGYHGYINTTHDSRVLQFEFNGDPVPAIPLLTKTGDIVHLHGNNLAALSVDNHSMALYSSAVHLLDDSLGSESEISTEQQIVPNVLLGAQFNGGIPLVGVTNDNLVDTDIFKTYEFIVGGGGSDILGDTGGNRMYGGPDNDTYIVDNASDIVIESVSAGIDTVESSITYTLGTNVENLMLVGIASINGSGNSLDNIIFGNNGNNILHGGVGNDTLNGGYGNDTFDGGDGSDTVILSGNFAEYIVTYDESMATYQIEDKIANRDGTDSIHLVENVRFADGVRSVSYLIPDTTSPTVSITDNINGTAIGDITYTLIFSEVVSGFTIEDISVVNGSKGAFTLRTGADAGKVFTLVVHPNAGLEGNLFVDVISGVASDSAGNGNIEATESIQAVDNQAPSIIAYNPTDEQAGTAVTSNIVLTFSEAIQKGSGTIALHSGLASGPIVESYNASSSSNLSVSGDTLTINPTADLSNGTHYYVTFESGSIKDLAGNNYAGTTSYDFTTIAETTPPTVSVFSPADGVTGVSVTSDIVLTFSEAIQKGSGTIALHNGLASGPIIESYNASSSSNLSVSGNTLTINPTADLSNGTHYYVTFESGSIKDLAGNNYAGTTSYDFNTIIESIPPTITSFSPVYDAIRVPVGSNIAITFSEPVQLGTEHITLKTHSGSVVETYTLGSSNVTINGNVMTINPTYDLANSTGYKLDIEHGAVMDLAGNDYASTTNYTFTTIGLTSSEAILERAYIAYFGRPAEPEGFNWWLSNVSSQGGIDAVMTNVYRDFCKSSEYLRAYASDLDPVTHAVINAPHLLNSIYENLFHRDIEQGGLDYWGTLVSQGAVTINSVVVEVLNGARNSDFDAVNSKIDAAIALTHKVDEINASGYAGDNAAHVAHDWLSGIYDASTLDAALVNASLTAAAEQIIAAGTQVSLVGVLAA